MGPELLNFKKGDSMEGKKYPLFIKEDINGFFALFQNNLANFVVITITMLGFGYPPRIVFGLVVPGAAISVLFGNLYYAHMAKKLAEKEKRLDVTALSYGISTPVMFVYLYSVAKPALDFAQDPDLAIKICMAACFLGGFIEASGAVIGPWLKRNLPRASMLGALCGVAFSVIAGQMFFHTFESPAIGMFVLTIVLVGLIAQRKMPFRVPASLFAIIIGTVLAYVIKEASVSDIAAGLNNVGIYLPKPTLGIIEGLKMLFGPMKGLLAAIIPISVYNFIETMNNVEAMAAAGDSYDVREAQLADGIGTIIGTFFGGAFPTTVYLASVSSKWLRAGRGYSIANGFVFLIASTFGIIAALSAIIPLQVVAPILVFVGISMISQTFISIEPKHSPAVVLAMLPYFANYLSTKFAQSASEALNAVSPAIVPLGEGSMFTGLILGAILAFVLNDEFIKAAITSLVGAVLTALGFMHSPRLAILYRPQFVLAYIVVAAILIILYYLYCKSPEEKTSEERKIIVD